jgi:hypothetical protein
MCDHAADQFRSQNVCSDARAIPLASGFTAFQFFEGLPAAGLSRGGNRRGGADRACAAQDLCENV